MIKIAAATGNKNKLREFGEIFTEMGLEVSMYSAKDLGLYDFPPEDADTFDGNSLIKAKALFDHIKKNNCGEFVVIADDSGISVDALFGKPGVYSARYSGPEATDESNLQKLLFELNATGDKERTGRYTCAMTAICPDETVLSAIGYMEGTITYEKAGTGGFGYDPIFFIEKYQKTVAELTPEQKNEISHRGKAVREICKLVKEHLEA